MEFGMDTTGIEFKRKAYDAILEWKNHLAGKTALLGFLQRDKNDNGNGQNDLNDAENGIQSFHG